MTLLWKVYNVTMTGSKLRKNDFQRQLVTELEKDIIHYNEYISLAVESNTENNDNDVVDVGNGEGLDLDLELNLDLESADGVGVGNCDDGMVGAL